MIWYFLRNKLTYANILQSITIGLLFILTYFTIDFVFKAAYDFKDVFLRYALSIAVIVLIFLVTKYKPMKKLWVKDVNFDKFRQFYKEIPSAYFITIGNRNYTSKQLFEIQNFEDISSLNSLISWIHNLPTNSTLLICGENNEETLAIKKYVQCIINGFDESMYSTIYPNASEKVYNSMLALG